MGPGWKIVLIITFCIALICVIVFPLNYIQRQDALNNIMGEECYAVGQDGTATGPWDVWYIVKIRKGHKWWWKKNAKLFYTWKEADDFFNQWKLNYCGREWRNQSYLPLP